MSCLRPDTSCQKVCQVVNIAMSICKISNTLICTLHDFLRVKVSLDLFIQALLLDDNLALE